MSQETENIDSIEIRGRGSKEILDEVAEVTGWNDQSRLLILSKYLDNYSGSVQFGYWLKQEAKRELEMRETDILENNDE